jgi:hypothetical protein
MTGNGKKSPGNAHQRKASQTLDKSEKQVISKDWTFACAPMMDWTYFKHAAL